MQGNVLEWCQEAAMFFDTETERMSDTEQLRKLANSDDRVLRGGSFANVADVVRSAYRLTFQPVVHLGYFGFRVSRTLPPVPLTALPLADGG